jgi:hypothetical protein
MIFTAIRSAPIVRPYSTPTSILVEIGHTVAPHYSILIVNVILAPTFHVMVGLLLMMAVHALKWDLIAASSITRISLIHSAANTTTANTVAK